VALFECLRTLFDLQPELVVYDLTSTYLECGGQPSARHGHSRDGKPRNVQVLVGIVMVDGWPIAHHVWGGNRRDSTTVREVIEDVKERFGLARIIFVGDRGMVTQDNLAFISEQGGQGFLVGMTRRRNAEAETLIDRVDESKWIECEVGINAQEKKSNPPRTRVQEVPCDRAGVRVFVVDSAEHREGEQRQREKAMKRVREALAKIEKRLAEGQLKRPEKIGAAVERALQKNHGFRYYTWRLVDGKLEISEHPRNLAREKKYEGKYLIQTDQTNLTPTDAVAHYKDLNEVERGFRSLKDPLGMRPIWHHLDRRVEAHIFVAAVAFLIERMLERALKEAKVNLSARSAIQALQPVRYVRDLLCLSPSHLEQCQFTGQCRPLVLLVHRHLDCEARVDRKAL
jgi:transposase